MTGGQAAPAATRPDLGTSLATASALRDVGHGQARLSGQRVAGTVPVRIPATRCAASSMTACCWGVIDKAA